MTYIKKVYGVCPKEPIVRRPSLMPMLRAIPVVEPEAITPEQVMFAVAFGIFLGVLFGLI